MLASNTIKSRLILAFVLSVALVVFLMIEFHLSGINELVQTTSVFPKVVMAFTRIFIVVNIYSWVAYRLIQYWNGKDRFRRDKVFRWIVEFNIILLLVLFFTLISSLHEPPIRDDSFFIKSFKAIVFVGNFIMAAIVFATQEIWDILEHNQQLQLSLAQAEKEKIASQLFALQQKVNPHFMFNSLNVLSELIYEDTQKADLFIRDFANVYRYVLELNDDNLVTVQQEVDFLQSYLFLQQIRFGESLQIEQVLEEKILEQQIPPLALQTLFENAIKHNRISIEEPLCISLKNENGFLVVQNNLQFRKNVDASKGIGLQNLQQKYQLISSVQPVFFKTKDTFVAKIPLVK